jgi:Ca2+-binding EF-hand superfamily protein
MAFAPRPPRTEVVTLSSAPGDSATVRASADGLRGRNFRPRARRTGTGKSPRSARGAPTLAEGATHSRRSLSARPSTADPALGRSSKRAPNGHRSSSGSDDRVALPLWAAPPSPDAEDPRKARSLDSQKRRSHMLATRNAEYSDRLLAMHKPTRSLRDSVFVTHKSKPDDEMLQPESMKMSKWKGHDDPFSILTNEERLRQRLARKMRAASYTLGGQDWITLFGRYDTDHSGGLDFKEFCRALRRDGSERMSQVSDTELKQVFRYIDLNSDGKIDAVEWQDFLQDEMQKEQDGGAQQQGAQASRVQKFLAESIALERVVMRAQADLHSERVGVLPKGEIVAVTHVAGNRMHVRRLRWSVNLEQQEESKDSGWVSERAGDGSGRLLLEVLPRDEWTSRNYNELALTNRVEQLTSMRAMAVSYTAPGMLGAMQLQAQARERELRHSREQVLADADRQATLEAEGGSGSPPPLPVSLPVRSGKVAFENDEDSGGDDSLARRREHRSQNQQGEQRSEGGGRGGQNGGGNNASAAGSADALDKAALLASKILQRCKEPEEVTALLSILETEPREQWATLLARRQF